MKSQRQPDSASSTDAPGQESPASESLQPYGNDAVQESMKQKRSLSSRVIDDQQVLVSSESDAARAERIIEQIERDYGIDVNSRAAVEAMKSRFTWLPDKTRDALVTSEWTVDSLAAVQRALAHFAPVLGDRRERSSRGGTPQEIENVSMMDRAINYKGQLDSRVGGQYFGLAKTFAMFKGGMKYTPDFGDVNRQMEGTAVHEIAHGVLKPNLDDFIEAVDYWLDRDTPSGKRGAEKPITRYGQTNADEDLSEAAMFYFVDRSKLQRKCPERFAFFEKLVADWSKESDDGGSSGESGGSGFFDWWK